MKKLPILEKLREFRCSLERKKPVARPRPVTRLNATARRLAPSAMDDYDDDQPTTRLSSAFIVVLILHLVAVGGIFAFKGIKAHRLSRELPVASAKEPAAAPHAPAQSAADAANLAALAAARPASPPATPAQRVYKAHGGETLAKVAAQQGVSVGELAQYNALNPSAVLKPNQSVVIPPGKAAKPAPPAAPAAKPATMVASNTTAPASSADAKKAAFLDAHKDDSVAAFKAATPRAAATPASGASKATPKSYTVAKNDTVTSIARKYGVSTDSLMKLNKIDDPKKLQLNQQLQIPAKKTE